MDNGVAFVTGRLTRDPQFFGEGDKRRVVFSIAFNRGKDERRKTTYVDCIAWGRRADILENFTKGSGVSVSGDLETDEWEKDGKKHSKLRLSVTTITATTSNRNRESEEGVEQDVDVNATATAAANGKRNSNKRGKTDDDSAEIPF